MNGTNNARIVMCVGNLSFVNLCNIREVFSYCIVNSNSKIVSYPTVI